MLFSTKDCQVEARAALNALIRSGI